MKSEAYAAVDIGGTKTSVGLYNSEFKKITETATIPTESSRGCRDLVEHAHKEYKRLLNSAGLAPESVRKIGIACPGPLDLKKGHIVYIPTMGFKDEPLTDYFEDIFGLPAVLQNDTNAAALAESRIGAGQGCKTVVYVTISTGIGCGIAINGEILDGAFCAAGELGHMTVERNGRQCACGKRGCLELYSSGTAIASTATELLGRQLCAKEVFDAARGGEKTAVKVIADAADCLGYALAAMYQILDPDIIVLGGSVTKDYDFFKDDLLEAVKKYSQPIPGRDHRIVVSQYGGEQVMLGAAILSAM